MALLVFHTALVISPQDTLVIRAFAALLYFGSWESTIEFLKEEEAGAQVPFVPETLGPSQTKLDDLMEQTSHLASLVNSSVLTLTCSDALEQSLVRFSEPPQISGVVSVSLSYFSTARRPGLLFTRVFCVIHCGEEQVAENIWVL
jgi:hypothetical protein